MKVLSRILMSVISGVAALYFVFWVGGALLLSSDAAPGLWFLVCAALGLAVGRYVWLRTASLEAGLAGSVMLGALTTGGVGFAAGFFGPMILTPDANQGPLLGLFITGPLGFVLGAVGGGVYWLARRRSRLTEG
jgi:hypothetical protein